MNCTSSRFGTETRCREFRKVDFLFVFFNSTFTPQLAEAIPPRPITTDDLERDRVLAQRIALFGWIEEKHLDIPCDDDEGPENTKSTRHGFMMFAQQELLKINHYKAPRDKLICILNCCKVIFGPFLAPFSSTVFSSANLTISMTCLLQG